VRPQVRFRKRFDLSLLPHDWNVSRVAVDWKGSPLLLVEEGKPLRPSHDASMDARNIWLNTPPKAHHLIHWDGLSEITLRFEKSAGLFTFHVQPVGEGWLLGQARGGRADVYDKDGQPQRTLNLGDAINDAQTTPNGKIWVSYFDEGVYGRGIGSIHSLDRHVALCSTPLIHQPASVPLGEFMFLPCMLHRTATSFRA
jgi:hypothetical protein